MFVEILVVILFFAGVFLYVLARHGGRLHYPSTIAPSDITSSQKLFDSKTNDDAFFDGEEENYAETMSRLRSYGGA